MGGRYCDSQFPLTFIANGVVLFGEEGGGDGGSCWKGGGDCRKD